MSKISPLDSPGPQLDVMFAHAYPFTHRSAASPEQMGAADSLAVWQMGQALAQPNKGTMEQAVADCRKQGTDPNRFVYMGEKTQWYTPMLALLARSNMAARERVVACLKQPPREDGWRWHPHAQRGSFVLNGHRCQHGFEVLSVLLLGMGLRLPKAGGGAGEEDWAPLKAYVKRFFQACDEQPQPLDWISARGPNQECPLLLLTKHAPAAAVAVLWPFLRDRGANPALPDQQGRSAIDHLAERASVRAWLNPGQWQRTLGVEMLAQWREHSYEKAWAVPPSSGRRPRL